MISPLVQFSLKLFSLQESAVPVSNNIMCCFILIIQCKFMQGSGNGDPGIIASEHVSHSSNQFLLIFEDADRFFNLSYTVDPNLEIGKWKITLPSLVVSCFINYSS